MCKSAVFAVILAVGVPAGARTGKWWSFVTRSAGGACPPAVLKSPYHPNVFEIFISFPHVEKRAGGDKQSARNAMIARITPDIPSGCVVLRD